MVDETVREMDRAASDGGRPTAGGGFGWWERRGDLAVTLVLTVVTLLTAWAGFQSAKWSGAQAVNFSEAGRVRTDANLLTALGAQAVAVDVSLFVSWLEAAQPELAAGAEIETVTEGDSYAAFIYQRFDPDSLQPAVDEWLAERPFDSPGSSTPFGLDTYQPFGLAEGEAARTEAAAFSKAARSNNQQSDNYVVITVLFASALFLAGLCQKLVNPIAQVSLFATAFVILIIGVTVLIGQPIEFHRADLPFGL